MLRGFFDRSSTMFRSILLLLALAIAGVLPAGAQEEARRITVDEARKALTEGTAVLVDVRAAEAYQSEHAKGALSIPLDDVAARAGELPKDKLIITYCT
jgi:3-mercaptopyruvate sulfurtransferase SseA